MSTGTTVAGGRDVRAGWWKAKRRGAIYCAPGCGGNCTWKAYLKAKLRAAVLVRRLGKGYKARVHENLGWHFCAVSTCGRIKVHAYGPNRYSAMIGPPDGGGYWLGDGTTPRLAVAAATARMREAWEPYRDLLA